MSESSGSGSGSTSSKNGKVGPLCNVFYYLYPAAEWRDFAREAFRTILG